MMGFKTHKTIVQRQDPVLHTNIRVVVFEITAALNNDDKKQARHIFNGNIPLIDNSGAFGIFADFAVKLGYNIKAAQLYEKAGDRENSSRKEIYFKKALELYNGSGDISDSNRVQEKLDAI